jgi:hypothetical protein
MSLSPVIPAGSVYAGKTMKPYFAIDASAQNSQETNMKSPMNEPQNNSNHRRCLFFGDNNYNALNTFIATIYRSK